MTERTILYSLATAMLVLSFTATGAPPTGNANKPVTKGESDPNKEFPFIYAISEEGSYKLGGNATVSFKTINECAPTVVIYKLTSGLPVLTLTGNPSKVHNFKLDGSKVKPKSRYVALIKCPNGANEMTAVTDCFEVKLLPGRRPF